MVTELKVDYTSELNKDDKTLKLVTSKATERTFVRAVDAFKLSHKNHLQ